jgi:hypothetical protein
MWYVVCGMWYVVCGMWYVVCGMWYVVCGIWFMVYGIWYVVCGMWYVVCEYDVWYMIFDRIRDSVSQPPREHLPYNFQGRTREDLPKYRAPARNNPHERYAAPFVDFLGSDARNSNSSTRPVGHRTLGRTEARAGGAILSWGGAHWVIRLPFEVGWAVAPT